MTQEVMCRTFVNVYKYVKCISSIANEQGVIDQPNDRSKEVFIWGIGGFLYKD